MENSGLDVDWSQAAPGEVSFSVEGFLRVPCTVGDRGREPKRRLPAAAIDLIGGMCCATRKESDSKLLTDHAGVGD